jgi:hypothetical protein
MRSLRWWNLRENKILDTSNKMQDKTIKALSLKQPFATLLVNGKKRIEIRTWNTNYRGRFWVQASKTPYTKKEYL